MRCKDRDRTKLNMEHVNHDRQPVLLPCLGNRPHPSDGKPLFTGDDLRLQYTVTEVDPRIHFALVCGAKVPLFFNFIQ